MTLENSIRRSNLSLFSREAQAGEIFTQGIGVRSEIVMLMLLTAMLC